jgi:hypothetical protein
MRTSRHEVHMYIFATFHSKRDENDNQDSSVIIVTRVRGRQLEYRGSISKRGGDFSPFHSVQTDSGAHPSSHGDAGHSASSRAEVKICGAMPSRLHTSSYRGGYLCTGTTFFTFEECRLFNRPHLHGATSQKTTFFIVTAVKTSNPT